MVNLNYKLNDLLWDVESELRNELNTLNGGCDQIWICIDDTNAYNNYFKSGFSKQNQNKLLNKINYEINDSDDYTAYNRHRFMEIYFKKCDGELYIVFDLENDND